MHHQKNCPCYVMIESKDEIQKNRFYRDSEQNAPEEKQTAR